MSNPVNSAICFVEDFSLLLQTDKKVFSNLFALIWTDIGAGFDPQHRSRPDFI